MVEIIVEKLEVFIIYKRIVKGKIDVHVKNIKQIF